MIVYGDPAYRMDSEAGLERLSSRLAEVRRDGGESLDLLRTLLVEAGQLEQAVRDSQEVDEGSAADLLESATLRAAAALYGRWSLGNGAPPPIPVNVPRALALMEEVLERASVLRPSESRAEGGSGGRRGERANLEEHGVPAFRCSGIQESALTTHDSRLTTRFTVKLPEGYAFYLLYPEQYALAALEWLRVHGEEREWPALVVGIRTIGTSLSAMVTAVLMAHGRHVRRVTVRPEGHASVRTVELPPGVIEPGALALVVDEGPGISGSSMAATAEALVRAGIAPEAVSLLPAHAGTPGEGHASSAGSWWHDTPRFLGDRNSLRWDGLSLTETLAAQTERLVEAEVWEYGSMGAGGAESGHRPPPHPHTPIPPHGDPATSPLPRPRSVVEIQDHGGGLWRSYVYADPAEWPAAAVPFEAPKFRCVLEDGASILWRFAGLAVLPEGPAVEAAAARLDRLARAGWTVPALGTALGFVGRRWIEGRPLRREDASRDLLEQMGRYLLDAAAPPLPPDERASALERLAELLYWNAWELLGEETAERTRPLAAKAREWAEAYAGPTYGDGRLAPYEWLRAADGRLLKTDVLGHTMDHTAPGPQPLAWDVAGAIVEWGLDEPLREALLGPRGEEIPGGVLHFYCAAYAAFRAGLFAKCAPGGGSDPGDPERLRRACEEYGRVLHCLIELTY